MSKRVETSWLAFLATVAAHCVTVPVQAQTGPTANLLDMSIEDLLSMEVTSASRKKQSLAQTAAAVFVITRDDHSRRTNGQRSSSVIMAVMIGATLTGHYFLVKIGGN